MERKSGLDNIMQANQVGMELLLIDADVAETLLQAAETTNSEPVRSRRIAEAHKAYETIASMIGRLDPTPEQSRRLREKMDRVRQSLRAAGVDVAPYDDSRRQIPG